MDQVAGMGGPTRGGRRSTWREGIREAAQAEREKCKHVDETSKVLNSQKLLHDIYRLLAL